MTEISIDNVVKYTLRQICCSGSSLYVLLQNDVMQNVHCLEPTLHHCIQLISGVLTEGAVCQGSEWLTMMLGWVGVLL